MHAQPRTNQDAGPQIHCKRCGTCCRKGGPALHMEDLPLVVAGKIPLKALFTIRQGEPAFDNVNHSIAPAVTDIVKIKGGPRNASACYFYNHQRRHCGRYDARPAECRALKCWDIADIEKLYNCRRLARRHILAEAEGLRELVSDHQARCDYGHIAELAGQARRIPQAGSARQELLELIRFDQSLRQLTVERLNLDPEMQDFLYGRPLAFTIGMFQLRYAADSQQISVAMTPSAICYRRNGFTVPAPVQPRYAPR